jgi:acyl-CoA hydrolase
MDTFTLVRPEHLNHYGYLFGGQLLKWVDEFAWLVATRDFAGFPLVTRGMENLEFKMRILNGSILRFQILPLKQGHSSVTYGVNVHSDEPGATEEKWVFSTRITFVCVDAGGKKAFLPRLEKLRSET